jgi:hypothetical protein
MKKALIVLLILAIAGGLFAQELTFSGAVKTGLKITADDVNNGQDIGVSFYNDDAGKALRFDLNGAYTNNNYGVVFGLRTDVNNGFGVNVHNAYGWFSFVDGIIKVSGGIIDDGPWNTGGLEDYNDVKGNGLRLEIIPITGLNIGLVLRAPVLNLNIKQFLSETAFGAKYESDLFWIAAGLILDSTADGIEGPVEATPLLGDIGGDTPVPAAFDPVTGLFVPAPLISDADHGLVFEAGAGVKPIPGLAVSVEAKAFNASKMNLYGYFILDEDVSYKLLSDKLTVGLKSYQYFWGSDWSKNLSKNPDTIDDPLKPYVKLTPYVGYDVLDTVNVGLSATFGFWKDVLDLEFALKPAVTYQFAENAKIAAFYNFRSLNYYKDVSTVPDGRKTDKFNTIQIDLIWTF